MLVYIAVLLILIPWKYYIKMANKVTTEWFDIHVKHGNFLPNQKESTLYQDNKAYQEQMAEQNKLQNVLNSKTNQQIEQMEDDLDVEDEFYKEYMKKRMAEIQELSKKAKYGTVYQISRDQYVREVTEADPESFVVLHLYQDYIETSVLVNQYLSIVAPKYPLVKFVKIVATKCVEDFPDSSVPCILIYKARKLVSNTARVDKYLNGGVQSFEQFLQEQGAFFVELKSQEQKN